MVNNMNIILLMRCRIMKKYILLVYVVVFTTFLTVSCSKPKSKDVSAEQVFNKVLSAANIESAQTADLTEQENAEQYGLSTDDYDEGFAAFSENPDKADKLIVIKSKDKQSVEDVEKSISSFIVGLNTTWKSIDTEANKVENHVFKTKDLFVLLYVGEKNENIEKIFDNEILE